MPSPWLSPRAHLHRLEDRVGRDARHEADGQLLAGGRVARAWAEGTDQRNPVAASAHHADLVLRL